MKTSLWRTGLALLALALVSSSQAQNSEVTHNSWTSGAPMPVATQGAAAVGHVGYMYVVGGYNSSGYLDNLQIYDPSTDSWKAGASVPVAISGAAVVSYGKLLYLVGGFTTSGASDIVYIYHPQGNRWSSATNPMPTARGYVGAAIFEGRIYVIGGSAAPQGEPLATVESFDLGNGTWTEETAMLNAKSSPSVATIQGIVVADGYESSGDTGDNEELYGGWRALPSDPEPRDQACTVKTGNGLFVAGGVDNGNEQNSTEVFSLSKNSWSTKATEPNWVTYAAGASVKSIYYCFGGGSSNAFNGDFYNYTQIYQP